MQSLLAGTANLRLDSENDALDIIGSGLPACILTESDLHPSFFDLSNGLAGAAFQKFVNYNYPLALVVADDHNYGVRVTELIRDHRTHHIIRFFESIEQAEIWLNSVVEYCIGNSNITD